MPFTDVENFTWRVAPTASQVDMMFGSREKTFRIFPQLKCKTTLSHYNDVILKKLVVFLEEFANGSGRTTCLHGKV